MDEPDCAVGDLEESGHEQCFFVRHERAIGTVPVGDDPQSWLGWVQEREKDEAVLKDGYSGSRDEVVMTASPM